VKGGGQKTKGSKNRVDRGERGIYTLKVQILRARSGVSRKPGISGKVFGVSAPPESSE
jgi:hypothetical protein